MEKHYCICTVCGTKHLLQNWEKHCKTKIHNKNHEKYAPWISKEIFNSRLGTKQILLFSFLPKVKWKDCNWRVVISK